MSHRPETGSQLSDANFVMGVHLQGIVTHMTDVKPLITVATYVEDDTGIEVYQPVIGATLRPELISPKNAAEGDYLASLTEPAVT